MNRQTIIDKIECFTGTLKSVPYDQIDTDDLIVLLGALAIAAAPICEGDQDGFTELGLSDSTYQRRTGDQIDDPSRKANVIEKVSI